MTDENNTEKTEGCCDKTAAAEACTTEATEAKAEGTCSTEKTEAAAEGTCSTTTEKTGCC